MHSGEENSKNCSERLHLASSCFMKVFYKTTTFEWTSHKGLTVFSLYNLKVLVYISFSSILSRFDKSEIDDS